MGKKSVPTVAQLYSPLVAHIDLALFAVGILGMVTGVVTGISPVVRIAAILVASAVALFVSQIARVALATSFRGIGSASVQPTITKAIR